MITLRSLSLAVGLSLAACGTQQVPPQSASNTAHVLPSRGSVALGGAPLVQTPDSAGRESESNESSQAQAEPENLSVHARSVAGDGRTIPNVFLGLDRCAPGTERSDLRTESLGEVACRDGRGELQGPYASNLLDPTSDLPAGTAERGQYEGGVRVGTWFKMRWGGSPFVSYEVETYQDGQVVTAKALGAGSPPPPWRDPSVDVASPSSDTGAAREPGHVREEQATGFARTQSD